MSNRGVFSRVRRGPRSPGRSLTRDQTAVAVRNCLFRFDTDLSSGAGTEFGITKGTVRSGPQDYPEVRAGQANHGRQKAVSLLAVKTPHSRSEGKLTVLATDRRTPAPASSRRRRLVRSTSRERRRSSVASQKDLCSRRLGSSPSGPSARHSDPPTFGANSTTHTKPRQYGTQVPCNGSQVRTVTSY